VSFSAPVYFAHPAAAIFRSAVRIDRFPAQSCRQVLDPTRSFLFFVLCPQVELASPPVFFLAFLASLQGARSVTTSGFGFGVFGSSALDPIRSQRLLLVQILGRSGVLLPLVSPWLPPVSFGPSSLGGFAICVGLARSRPFSWLSLSRSSLIFIFCVRNRYAVI
jgi:hypothetical protein